MLHLDLYNFEEPFSAHSKYILTSPRSLEACSRFGIKPVELLHKPLSYFESEEFITNGQPDPRDIYKEHERQRLKKLRLCREERDRLIEEDQWSFVTSDQLTTSTPSSSAQKYKESRSYNNHLISYCTDDSIRSDPNQFENSTDQQDTQNSNGFSKTFSVQPSHNNKPIQKQRKPKLNHAPLLYHDKHPIANTESDYHKLHTKIRQHTELKVNSNSLSHDGIANADCKLLQRQHTQQKEAKNRNGNSRNTRLAEAKADTQTRFDRWKREFDKQVQQRDTEMLSKRVAEEERRRLQEAKRRQQDFELDMIRHSEYSQLTKKQREAIKIKEYLNLQRQLDIHAKNEDQREKHELQMNLLHRENRRKEHELRREFTEKQEIATRNAEKMMNERCREMSENRLKENEKRALQQEQLAIMENEMHRWQRELGRYQELSLKKAEERAKSTNRQKSTRAYEQRTQREMDHALNRSRVINEDEMKRREVLLEIEMKNKKSQIVAEDKLNFIKSCRNAAISSSSVRDSERDRVIRSSFDKMAKEAERLARLDRLSSYN